MLGLLKETIEEDYPMMKEDDVETKIINLIGSVEVYSLSNFLIKNFMLLASIS